VRDDLQHAYASLEWAREQIPELIGRADEWLRANKLIEVRNAGPRSDCNVLIVGTKVELPLRFSVEVGAYINTIRSSLDILASALAVRCGVTDARLAQFPFVNVATDLTSHNTRVGRFMASLSDEYRVILEDLQPYEGGDPILCSLHRLDIMRKHRRLLGVRPKPLAVQFPQIAFANGDVSTVANWSVDDEGGTVVALIAKDCPEYVFDASLHITFAEEEHFGTVPIFDALRMFCNKAHNIIEVFEDN
jgi:hypothetical protein